MTSWHDLWQRRELLEQAKLIADQELATYVDDEERHEIEDLSAPPGKRFLFDDTLKVADGATSSPQAPSESSLLPSWANGLPLTRARLHLCARTCRCPCVRCAYSRWRVWRASGRADPP